MTPVKKVEIVTASLEIEHVLQVLDEMGVSGYTVIRDVVGRGSRGVRAGDELTGALKNSYVMTACSPADAERVVEAVRPILKRFGGVALVSDCHWVQH
jgi:nitrogen regulatory protein PII